jgi:hypothetical protein
VHASPVHVKAMVEAGNLVRVMEMVAGK